jgi:hypothetical protein
LAENAFDQPMTRARKGYFNNERFLFVEHPTIAVKCNNER